jgi:16S rRNA processing protein RimM
MVKDKIVIGKITGVHGVRGEIKVFPLTDNMNRFYDLDYFLCGNTRYGIENVRTHKGQVLVKAVEINDRTQAKKLQGKMMEVNREDAVELNEGEYFIEDLKGMKVYDTSSEKTAVIADILQTGAVDVILFNLDGKELMMPYLKEYVSEVNIKEGYMKADLSKGVM